MLGYAENGLFSLPQLALLCYAVDMIYENMKPGLFLARPNRFIAQVQLEGKTEICHVKNTGRCRELLVPGAKVLVQDCPSPRRKTRYDLISVWKGRRLVNMDAAAPNRVFGEWLRAGHLFPDAQRIQAEHTHGDSRFDFYVETPTQRVFIEVKGVTLEEDGAVYFPDAPTERGVKHLRGLTACRAEGFAACVFFVVQMAHVRWFSPNRQQHPAFAQALVEAARAGVQVLAYDCDVTENSLTLARPVEVRL